MADRVEGLAYKLSVDSSQFTGGLATSTDRLQKFTNDTQAQANKIQGSMTGIGDKAKGLFTNLQAEGPGQALGALQNSILGISSSLTASVGPIGLFTAGLTAAFGLLVSKADEAAERVRNINNVARTLGQGGIDTQVLLRVFEKGGFDQQGAQQALFRFQSRLGDIHDNPNSQAGQALQSIGLDPQLVSQATLRESLAATFEALKRVEDANLRARAAQDIFGRSAIDLAPLIARGGQAINAAALDVERFGRTQDQLNRLKAQDQQARQFEQQNGSISQVLGRALDSWLLGFSNIVRDLDYSATVFLGRVNNRGILAAATAGPDLLLGADHTSNGGNAINSLDVEANKLLDTWKRLDETINLTARQRRIVELQGEGASLALVEQLRAQDAILTSVEKEANLRRQITSQLQNQKDISFAIVGVDAGGIEAAKIVADLQTRQNNGVDDRQNRLLEAIEEAVRRQLREQEETNELLDEMRSRGLVVAASF